MPGGLIARFRPSESAYDRGVDRAGRKPWRWIAGSVGVAFVAAACLAAFRREPYSFLDRFHPRVVDVDLAKMLGAPPPGTKGAPVVQRPKIKMLVFRNEDAGKVLQAMRDQLTPSRGFSARHAASGGRDDNWDFFQGSLPSPVLVSRPEGTAMYTYGDTAALEEQMFEQGTSHLTYWKQGQKTACIVLLFHEPNWLERSLGAIRELLHIG